MICTGCAGEDKGRYVVHPTKGIDIGEGDCTKRTFREVAWTYCGNNAFTPMRKIVKVDRVVDVDMQIWVRNPGNDLFTALGLRPSRF